MAINRGQTIDGALVPNATASIFSPPADATRVVINSAVFYANAAVTKLNVYIVPNGGSPTTSNRVISRALAADDSDLAAELIGQSIESGGSIQADDGGTGGTAVNFVGTYTEFTGDS